MSKTSLIFFKKKIFYQEYFIRRTTFINVFFGESISQSTSFFKNCAIFLLARCKISVIDIKKVELYMTDEATKVVFYS